MVCHKPGESVWLPIQNKRRKLWCKADGEYWAKRPMTRQMIKYASLDVLVLIPEVYMKMKSLVESQGLSQQVNERISEEIAEATNLQLPSPLRQRNEEIILAVLQKFARTVPFPQRLSDVADEDVLTALSWLKFKDQDKDGLPPNIRELKVQVLAEKVKEIMTELQEKGDDTVPTNHMFNTLYKAKFHAGDEELKKLAQKIERQLEEIAIKDMARKYTDRTPIVHVAGFEKRVLNQALHPDGEKDPRVNPVVLRLYWLHQEENIDDSIQRFTDNPSNYRINDRYAKKLRYFISGQDVPRTLKTKARDFIDRLQAAGKVARPPRRR